MGGALVGVQRIRKKVTDRNFRFRGHDDAMRPSDKGTRRLIDANLNRAREGIRVVEEAARFYWKDARFFRALRECRHEIEVLVNGSTHVLLEARDSRGDPGRVLPEGPRRSVGDVAIANMRRAEEAMRVLEEYSKVFSRSAGPGFKALRYRLYCLEKRLLKKI